MKKLITLLLAGAIALSMAACSSQPNPSEASSEPASAAESESPAEAPSEAESPAESTADEDDAEDDTEDGAPVAFPEINGYTKTEQDGGVIYSGEDGSMLTVAKWADGGDEAVEGFKTQSDEFKAQMDEAMGAMNSVVDGMEMTGEFTAIGGTDAYVLTTTYQGTTASVVALVMKGNDFYMVTGASPAGDVNAAMEELIKQM